MNIYDAIMRAADHIERHPGDFQWRSCVVPECGTPGCAVGWICHFLGQPIGSQFNGTKAFGECELHFYLAMNRISGDGWRWDASMCAKTLRLYAAKYHAPERNFARELYAKVSTQRLEETA